jgi:hypothetical protein
MKNGHQECAYKREVVNAPARTITGMWLAHVQLGLHERAYEAADLFNGVNLFVQPTIGQCATLCRVNRSYVSWAIKRPNDRQLIVSGAVPLVTPPAVKAFARHPRRDDRDLLK